MLLVRTHVYEQKNKRRCIINVRPFDRHFLYFMLVLPAIMVMSAVLPAPTIQSSFRSAYAVGVSSPLCKLTIQNNDRSLQPIAQYYQLVFQNTCPPLVKRFGSTPNMYLTLAFKSDLPANESESSNDYIGVSSALLRGNPDQATDQFILQLTQSIQNYDPNNTTTWFPQAMTYYACSIYCPMNDSFSFLPSSVESTDSYQTPDVGARFLHWLEQHTTPNIVDQLNHALQTKQSFSATFQRLTGSTVDEEWSKYRANSELAPLQRFPVPSDPATRSISCKLTIQNSDSSLDNILQRYQIAFNTACPELVARWGLKASVANNVVLKVEKTDGIAETGGNETTINSDWIRQNPQLVVGALIHELTHVIQTYPIYLVWFTEGMADYSRSVYGPKDDNWSLPQSVSPSNSYNDGYGIAARFLHWLEQHTTPNIVDQLNHALQTKQSFSATFQRLTGSTVDEEWSKYEADPTITPFKRIPAPDN